eukprot:scpid29272/ scgid6073/ Ubiquitin carboxyl-terminal hydrolase CYLD; Deubiquitinating enzyme CYLD; Ubiquitin thioesterase CYLD; Ubiquitin-specific-processing protease CYLD
MVFLILIQDVHRDELKRFHGGEASSLQRRSLKAGEIGLRMSSSGSTVTIAMLDFTPAGAEVSVAKYTTKELSEKVANLLRASSDPKLRLELFLSRTRLEGAQDIGDGKAVRYRKNKYVGGTFDIPGMVISAGPAQGKHGTWFTVEILGLKNDNFDTEAKELALRMRKAPTPILVSAFDLTIHPFLQPVVDRLLAHRDTAANAPGNAAEQPAYRGVITRGMSALGFGRASDSGNSSERQVVINKRLCVLTTDGDIVAGVIRWKGNVAGYGECVGLEMDKPVSTFEVEDPLTVRNCLLGCPADRRLFRPVSTLLPFEELQAAKRRSAAHGRENDDGVVCGQPERSVPSHPTASADDHVMAMEASAFGMTAAEIRSEQEEFFARFKQPHHDEPMAVEENHFEPMPVVGESQLARDNETSREEQEQLLAKVRATHRHSTGQEQVDAQAAVNPATATAAASYAASVTSATSATGANRRNPVVDQQERRLAGMAAPRPMADRFTATNPHDRPAGTGEISREEIVQYQEDDDWVKPNRDEIASCQNPHERAQQGWESATDLANAVRAERPTQGVGGQPATSPTDSEAWEVIPEAVVTTAPTMNYRQAIPPGSIVDAEDPLDEVSGRGATAAGPAALPSRHAAVGAAKLTINDMVTVMARPGMRCTGTLRYIGRPGEDMKEDIAGIELDEEYEQHGMSSGAFVGQELFRCDQGRKRALFVRASACQLAATSAVLPADEGQQGDYVNSEDVILVRDQLVAKQAEVCWVELIDKLGLVYSTMHRDGVLDTAKDDQGRLLAVLFHYANSEPKPRLDHFKLALSSIDQRDIVLLMRDAAPCARRDAPVRTTSSPPASSRSGGIDSTMDTHYSQSDSLFYSNRAATHSSAAAIDNSARRKAMELERLERLQRQRQPDSKPVRGSVPPRNVLPESFFGWNRGIQGQHNSCYMDASLFAMFYQSMVFDNQLVRPIPENVAEGMHDLYEHVQIELRESIVNPLRENGFVSDLHVLKLRHLLRELIAGIQFAEKDPEEYLVFLWEKVLQVEPFLSISASGHASTSYTYQMFVNRNDNWPLPTIQQLMEESFCEGQLRLTRVSYAVMTIETWTDRLAFSCYTSASHVEKMKKSHPGLHRVLPP